IKGLRIAAILVLLKTTIAHLYILRMCAPHKWGKQNQKYNNKHSLCAHITLLIFDNAKIVLLIF
ncbi:TPA: hypothetical protein ACF6GW_004445, partial [Salmonella enterica]